MCAYEGKEIVYERDTRENHDEGIRTHETGFLRTRKGGSKFCVGMNVVPGQSLLTWKVVMF